MTSSRVFRLVCGASLFAVALSAFAQAPIVRDSAEWQIILNRAPTLPAARTWRIEPKPTLTIGDPKAPTEGDSLYEFGRVMGVSRLASGQWAVALPTYIRVYDAAGKYLRSMGRAGDGPGEFRQIMGLRPTRGDTLLVTDNSEVEYYAGDGKFLGQGASRKTTPGAYVWPSAALGDGSYIGINWNDRSQSYTGRTLRRLPLIRVSRDGAKLDTIATLPVGEIFGSGRPGLEIPVTYSPGSLTAAVGTRIFYSYPVAAEVTEYSATGKPLRVSRLAIQPRPVTSADQDEYKKWYLDEALGEGGGPLPPRLRTQREQMLNQSGFVSTFPVHSMMLADKSGQLWLRRFDVRQTRYKPGPVQTITVNAPSTWDVLDGSGRWLCTLDVPANFTPLEIGSDYVVGVAHDADDVEMIRVYRIIKP